MRNFLRNGFAALVVLLFISLVSLASAQTVGMHGNGSSPGVPASVTSSGFGGHPGFHGVPASVTSHGFGANNNFRGVPAHGASFGFGVRDGPHESPFEHGRHHRHRPLALYNPYYGGYSYGYPYYVDDEDYGETAADQAPASDSRDRDYRNSDYRADDDRQVLQDDYRAGLNRPSEHNAEKIPQPVAEQPSTLLIFKDGHQQEISNYAIVGETLYDLSDGRSKKVQLTELDLTATVKENDQRGIEFQLPAQARLN